MNAMTSSFLDDETIADLQRDIHAVVSADSTIMSKLGSNLKVHRPFWADLRTPPWAEIYFGCSTDSLRCTVLANMRVPVPETPPGTGPGLGMLIGGFREDVRAQPDRSYLDDLQKEVKESGSEVRRLMKLESRFDKITLIYSKGEFVLFARAPRSVVDEWQPEDFPEESEENEIEQDLEQIDVPVDNKKRALGFLIGGV